MNNKDLNDFDTMFSDKTAIILISGSKSKLGIIINTNFGVYNLLGYSSLELIGKNVSIIIPSIIGNHHNEFLESHIQTGKENLM